MAAIGGALGGILGAAGSYFSAKALQEDAQKFTTSFYKQRYQRQMKDMREAGLNPILAYKTGVPGTASAGIASAGGIAGAVSGGITAGASQKAATAQTTQATSAKGLRDEQITTEKSKQELNLHSARAAEAQARRTNVGTALDSTGLPKAQHQKNFYLKYGGPAVTAQEGGASAKAVWSPFGRPR